jgi:hypothetical protein
MALTTQQLTALKAAITANPTWAAYPLTADGYYDLAATLNGQATPAFWVWSTNVDVQSVRAAVVWANLTPADVPDGTQTWANRSLQCQGKQFNLQMLVPMTGTMSAADPNLRAGLQDALTAVRSGAAGASQSAGWTAVQLTLVRRAKYGEQILADTATGNGGTKPTAATMVFEGSLTDVDVMQARNS